MNWIERASLACLLFATATVFFNPYLRNRFWRNVSVAFALASGFLFVIGGI